jgi:hypothetical protein
MKKQKKIDTQPAQGVRSSVSEELLTYANGELIPAEHYSDFTDAEADQAEAMTPEEVYIASLEAGLPEDPLIEETLNMKRVAELRTASAVLNA